METKSKSCATWKKYRTSLSIWQVERSGKAIRQWSNFGQEPTNGNRCWKKEWVNVLNRFVDVIQYLTKQSLPVRDHRKSLGGEGTPGNCLELIKLISKYAPVLREHVTHIRLVKKMTLSYLSLMFQNAFIELLASQVRQKFVKEIKEAKYTDRTFLSKQLFVQIIILKLS